MLIIGSEHTLVLPVPSVGLGTNGATLSVRRSGRVAVSGKRLNDSSFSCFIIDMDPGFSATRFPNFSFPLVLCLSAQVLYVEQQWMIHIKLLSLNFPTPLFVFLFRNAETGFNTTKILMIIPGL